MASAFSPASLPASVPLDRHASCAIVPFTFVVAEMQPANPCSSADDSVPSEDGKH